MEASDILHIVCCSSGLLLCNDSEGCFMKKDYHPYVFDNGKFVGQFEEMYQNESTEYDSWCQSDLRDYGYLISLAVLNKYNFNRVLDVGCGKGLFTSLLKKQNNFVLGVDASTTAIQKARASFKDVEFQTLLINQDLLADNYAWIFMEYKNFDLIVLKEVLSYIKGWRSILEQSAKFTKYIFISLDLPATPIGFVKSFEELVVEVRLYYEILVQVEIKTTGNQMLILGKVKK